MARDLVFVKPLGGAKIRKPDTKEYLKDEGEELERSSFWIRRQMAGEVSITKVAFVTEEAVTAAPKTKAAAKKKAKEEVTDDADIV